MIEHLLLVSVAVLVVATFCALTIFRVFAKGYRHQETRYQVEGAVVSLIIAVLFSVLLNNLFALKRDRDARIRTLRDQHYAQLRPVLRTEAVKLQYIAEQMNKQRYITDVNKNSGEVHAEISDLLWPDVISSDLSHHFPEYETGKRQLMADIDAHEQKFRDALSVQLVKPHHLEAKWKQIVPFSILEHCLGRGEGMKVVPFKPTAEFTSYCTNLKRSAENIEARAETLSRSALVLSEGTVLQGSCGFIRTSELSQ